MFLSLTDRLIAGIAAEGPITVAAFMDICLNDAQDGYYATRPRLGSQGDFITAPHVSQMFGELIGLWALGIWQQLGKPCRVRLVEMGPGDGTLIGDLLRSARAFAPFCDAIDLWLVEPSLPLRGLQQAVLAGVAEARWTGSLAEIPRDVPIILLANEVLDCLPISQFQKTGLGWRERCIGTDRQAALTWVLSDSAATFAGEPWQSAQIGSVCETSMALVDMGLAISNVIATTGGAALMIDYGRAEPGFGDTLQALSRHKKQSPLQSPGEADLTAHVDFPNFLAAVRRGGAVQTVLATQGDFLRALGIVVRAKVLATANPKQADLINRQVDRLISAEGMGELFKVACIYGHSERPPGFEVPE